MSARRIRKRAACRTHVVNFQKKLGYRFFLTTFLIAGFLAAGFAAGFFAIARPAKLTPHLQNRASRLTSGGCDVRIPLEGWLDMPVL